MRRAGLQLLLYLEITAGLQRALATGSPNGSPDTTPQNLSALVTNVGQLRTLSYVEFNRGRPLGLTGTVTIVDTERRSLVLQDATGALLWHSDAPVDAALMGKTVRIACTSGAPYVPTLPDFPYRPSGSDIQTSFEAPSNWGDYHLTRMAGYLRPPASGEYSFWIASDDSSELWLSVDDNPARVRKVAFVMEGFWTDPHQWDRFASQRSEPVRLRADKTYYIEAFQEQALQADHLSVAWEGPGIALSVIPGACLTPWPGKQGASMRSGSQVPANGVLREYWTNYAAGSVRLVTASGAVDAGFAGRDVAFQVLGPGTWPEPRIIDVREPLLPDNNFCWIQAEGIVSFVSTEGEGATLELVAGPRRVVVRVARWNPDRLRAGLNRHVQVRGVCEGVADETGGWLRALFGFQPRRTSGWLKLRVTARDWPLRRNLRRQPPPPPWEATIWLVGRSRSMGGWPAGAIFTYRKTMGEVSAFRTRIACSRRRWRWGNGCRREATSLLLKGDSSWFRSR